MGRTMTEVMCPVCQHSFLAPVTRVVRGLRKTCSRSCSSKVKIRSANGLCARAKRGEFTDIYRKNISKIHAKWTDETKHPRWKGDDAGYFPVHEWITKHYGQPKECEWCGLNDPNRKYHWANISKTYKRRRDDFIRMCVPCHRRYDGAGRKAWETRKRISNSTRN